MKAVVFEKYGSPDVLKVKEVDKPALKTNEVLVKINATSVNYGDLAARNFKHISPHEFNMPFLFWLIAKFSFGLSKPQIKILGSEFAGEIDAVGPEVRLFKKGDPVFGYVGQNMGAYAEYICMPENGCLDLKPDNMTDEEAAVVPYGSIMAIHLLRIGKIEKGEKVLIIGASGGIGSAAVQIAKSLGAEVTGVCGANRLDFVRALGADKVIDYKVEDFTQNGETYDLIFDVLGRGSFSRARRSLQPDGIYLLASFKGKQLLQMVWTSLFSRQKLICAIAPGSVEDLHAVKNMIETGKIKAVIDKTFPLEHAAEAHRYIENGNKKGHVVIKINHV